MAAIISIIHETNKTQKHFVFKFLVNILTAFESLFSGLKCSAIALLYVYSQIKQKFCVQYLFTLELFRSLKILK